MIEISPVLVAEGRAYRGRNGNLVRHFLPAADTGPGGIIRRQRNKNPETRSRLRTPLVIRFSLGWVGNARTAEDISANRSVGAGGADFRTDRRLLGCQHRCLRSARRRRHLSRQWRFCERATRPGQSSRPRRLLFGLQRAAYRGAGRCAANCGSHRLRSSGRARGLDRIHARAIRVPRRLACAGARAPDRFLTTRRPG
jgi:hypothetical protein